MLGFQRRDDADAFLHELRARLARFGLELHPDKTHLPQFGRHAVAQRARAGLGKPETFDFLGFTHICGRGRSGRYLLRRQTIKKRLRATFRAIRARLKASRHLPIPAVGAWLKRVLDGYFGYYAVPTNIVLLNGFRKQVTNAWFWALKRRSQRSRLTWERMATLESRWIPNVRRLHPLPEIRFSATTRGRSPVR